ncbi:MAG: D-alanine--D-alanine ligase [Frankiales bacterium]|nr:D-alanine--D-alanine ligase [Frankiales bacterium]
MTDLHRVVVLAGGLDFEREVSLWSGRRIAEQLRAIGIDALVRDVDAQLLPSLAADAPDAVFIALHGASGEDGAIRGVLELLGVPYAGAGPDACRLAWDKPSAKAAMRAAGVASPMDVVLPQTTFRELGAAPLVERIIADFGLPLMVKPASGGSAMGANVVRTAAALPAALMQCFSYGDTALVERFVDGVEVAVSVIDLGDGPVALPAVEIVPVRGVYDYSARYTPGETDYYTPARLDATATAAVTAAAVTAHTVLGLRDLSRTDLIVDRDGVPHFLEVNVSPGLTETSLFPMAAQAAGHEMGNLVRDLLHNAVQRNSGLLRPV